MGEAAIRAVVTDIEGTTSAIAFVKETLFPFAASRIDSFLEANRNDPEVRRLMAEAVQIAADEGDNDVRAALKRWIATDRKITPLKSLQGLIWQEGYRSGELKGHVYPDAAACLRRWAQGGLAVYVYSSGSVAAQKLIFGHAGQGDLTPCFSGYFDTTTGPKLEAASYRRIAEAIATPPGAVLFLSDHAGELDAARAAGLRTCQIVRAEDGTRLAGTHPAVPDFPAAARLFGLPVPSATD